MALPDDVEAQFAAIERANELGNKQREAIIDQQLDTSAAIISGMASLAVAKAALGGDFRGDAN